MYQSKFIGVQPSPVDRKVNMNSKLMMFLNFVTRINSNGIRLNFLNNHLVEWHKLVSYYRYYHTSKQFTEIYKLLLLSIDVVEPG